MAAENIRTQVDGWVSDEIARESMGETFGFAVTWGPAPVQTPNGMVMIPAWTAVITCLNPLLEGGDLFHLAQLGAPRPKEADVRQQVADGIRQLRELARSKISGANGARTPLVPG